MKYTIIGTLVATLSCPAFSHDGLWNNLKLTHNEYSYEGDSNAISARYEVFDNVFIQAKRLELEASREGAIRDMFGSILPVTLKNEVTSDWLGFGAYFDFSSDFSVSASLERGKSTDDWSMYTSARNFTTCSINCLINHGTIESYKTRSSLRFYWTPLNDLSVSLGQEYTQNPESHFSLSEFSIMYFFTESFGAEYIRTEDLDDDFYANRFSLVYNF